MRCKICHTEIQEFIIHENQNPKGRIIRRYECSCCGPLHFETLLPVTGDAK